MMRTHSRIARFAVWLNTGDNGLAVALVALSPIFAAVFGVLLFG